MWVDRCNSGHWHVRCRTRSLVKKMISMTAAEVAKVMERVERDRRVEFAPDSDRDHDQYGCDTTDHHSFNHTEDVFPY